MTMKEEICAYVKEMNNEDEIIGMYEKVINKEDVVNSPKHYTSGRRYECIDVMQDIFGRQAVIDFCKCNIFKYIWRAKDKNGEEDLKKAEWYETKLKELLNE